MGDVIPILSRGRDLTMAAPLVNEEGNNAAIIDTSAFGEDSIPIRADLESWIDGALERIIARSVPNIEAICNELEAFGIPEQEQEKIRTWLTTTHRLTQIEDRLVECNMTDTIYREHWNAFVRARRTVNDILGEFERTSNAELELRPAYFTALYEYLLSLLEDLNMQ